jgi:hypothetical protein
VIELLRPWAGRAQYRARGELPPHRGAQSRSSAYAEHRLAPERDARFPKRLQEKFAGRKFAPLDPPDLLDYEGAKLMFIGASEDFEREPASRSSRIARASAPPTRPRS